MEDHLPECACPVPFGDTPKNLKTALRHLMVVLRQTGRISAIPPAVEKPVDKLLSRFEEHLRKSCGLAEHTRALYLRQVRRFLQAKYGDGEIDLSGLNVTDLIKFVEDQASHYKTETVKALITALRSFLRFMAFSGLCDESLAQGVPTVRNLKLSNLPSYLRDDELDSFLAAFDRSSALGLRDYAMASCCLQLGLRAGEVARLCIEDLQWRAGTIRIQRTKSRRPNLLPIPLVVGKAIVAYLQKGRPSSPDRFVFVRHQVPLRGPLSLQAVCAAMARAFVRAGLKTPSRCTHVLRHTAATRMVRAGASIKEVADILGHRSLDTAAIYAKVDLPTLVEVALPWPEVNR